MCFCVQQDVFLCDVANEGRVSAWESFRCGGFDFHPVVRFTLVKLRTATNVPTESQDQDYFYSQL